MDHSFYASTYIFYLLLSKKLFSIRVFHCVKRAFSAAQTVPNITSKKEQQGHHGDREKQRHRKSHHHRRSRSRKSSSRKKTVSFDDTPPVEIVSTSRETSNDYDEDILDGPVEDQLDNGLHSLSHQ